MILTCVVTCDRLAYSKRCIESWQATARPQDRLIVIDNASTDGTREWLEVSGLPYVLNPENRYPGAAANQGWDVALEWCEPDYVHRSDNDIEYLPGWGDEVERQFAEHPELALLGILNLHEDRGGIPAGSGIEPIGRVGGNVVMRTASFRDGLRWDEVRWMVADGGMTTEDGPMSDAAGRLGLVAMLERTVANNLAFGRYWDFPAYYDRTAAERGLPDAEHSV